MTIASGGDDAATWATDGVIDEAMLETEALGCELAQVRSDVRYFAVQKVHDLIAEVVGGDEQDVERRLGGAKRRERE